MRYLIVDGYNIIGDWEELRELAQIDVDAARHLLYEELLNYSGYNGCDLLLVFDAYGAEAGEKVEKHSKSNNHKIVFTRNGQTADQYIEKFVRKNVGEMIVASSDALVQVMIFAYASRMSARELKIEVDLAKNEMRDRQNKKNIALDNGLWVHLDDSMKSKLDNIRRGISEKKPELVPDEKSSQSKQNIIKNINLKEEQETKHAKHEPIKKQKAKRKSNSGHGVDKKISKRPRRNNRNDTR